MSGLSPQVLSWALLHPSEDVLPLGGGDVLLVSVVPGHFGGPPVAPVGDVGNRYPGRHGERDPRLAEAVAGDLAGGAREKGPFLLPQPGVDLVRCLERVLVGSGTARRCCSQRRRF